MIEMASCISADEGVKPAGVLAIMLTSEPLDRSRPRPTLTSLCHRAGLNRFPPRMPRSMITMSAPSTASDRHGREPLFAGGATFVTPVLGGVVGEGEGDGEAGSERVAVGLGLGAVGARQVVVRVRKAVVCCHSVIRYVLCV